MFLPKSVELPIIPCCVRLDIQVWQHSFFPNSYLLFFTISSVSYRICESENVVKHAKIRAILAYIFVVTRSPFRRTQECESYFPFTMMVTDVTGVIILVINVVR
jgi:hypothetical protein